ncbi:hypothetical protein POTOM_008717 [Populus tomentosa]|uniref:Uncharacterized protein n=1 Tax=Populus tomentosa TaxID=118781 RepID=A0A8X8DC67_POPTO|nr:hypothetical protein POTOM_008717 [Populus tomentosa]
MALTRVFFAASILLLSSSVITSANDYSYDSKTDTVKPGYHPKSDANYDNTPKPDLPKSTLTIPKSDNEKSNYGYDSIPEAPLPIGIEGLVLCKSGSTYIPIKGALVRIACMAVDTNGYETTPFSCLTGATDANGYYYKPLPAFGLGDLKVTECKAYLESSPLETCKIPTDVNNGMSGALLSSYHILSSKNIKLYSMRTFFYTSETTPTPAGGY